MYILATVQMIEKTLAGRALISDWSLDSFIMAVYEEIIFSRVLDRKFWLNIFKISLRQPL